MSVTRKIRERIVLIQAGRLFKSGQIRKSIDFLVRENGRRPSASLEEALVRLRHEAFFQQSFTQGFSEWPPAIGHHFADHDGIPEIDRGQMSADVIRDGVFNRGSIIVRGLLPETDIQNLREGIEKAYLHHDMAMAGASSAETTPWFVPFQPTPRDGDQELNRHWYREGGAELAADSPRGLFNLIDVLERNLMVDLISEYLGERPGLSVRKTSLRKIPCDLNSEHGWHQDGAFLGKGISSNS